MPPINPIRRVFTRSPDEHFLACALQCIKTARSIRSRNQLDGDKMATINERDPAHGARASLILELINVHENLRKVDQFPLKEMHRNLFEDIRQQRNFFAHRAGTPDWSDVNWQTFDQVLVDMIHTLGASIEAAIKKRKVGK